MSKNKKIDVGKIISESLIIIVSVLFALFVNEWRTNHNDAKRISIIRNNISQELELNKSTTEELIDYYENQVLKKLNTQLEQDSLEEHFFDGHRFTILKVAPRGVIQKSFNTIAWELAKQENVSSKISFEKSKDLFEAYKMQSICDETVKRIITLITRRETHNKENLEITVTLLRDEMNEFYNQLKSLLRNYNRALETDQ